jgi:uncharacterized membrane protein YedE/YeeE
MLATLVSFACGGLLAAGFWLAGVSDPATIFAGFVPRAGWDPRLWLMFAAALVVQVPIRHVVDARRRALDGTAVGAPAYRLVDARLVTGSLIFGVGWGLCGTCPGPGLTALAAGAPSALLFTCGFLVAVVAYERRFRRRVGACAAP